MMSASSSMITTIYGIRSPFTVALYSRMSLAPDSAMIFWRRAISFAAQRRAATTFFTSVTTGTSRCGSFSYTLNSVPPFGSTRMSRSCSGVLHMRNPLMIELRHTDLPFPDAPATSRCGIFERSSTTSSPATFLPRRSGTGIFGEPFFGHVALFCHSTDSTISRNVTISRILLGI